MGGTGGSGSAAPRPTCTLKPVSAKVKRKKLTFSFRCDQAAKLVLSAKLTQRVGRKTKRYVVKSAAGSAKAGVPGTLTLTVPAAALKALKARKTLVAALTLTATGSSGQGRTTASIKKLKR